jgi:hypothetical protein
MRRAGLFLLLSCIALGAHLSGLRSAHASPSLNQPVFLEVGDTVQVAGAPVGCKVISRNGAKWLDCRISGPLAGSYGTLFNGTRLQVVRFRDNRVAKVVFTATHHGGFRVCR